MDRLIAINSAPFASADTAPASGTPQYATSGNPATGVAATVFPAYAWNMLQDEIYAVIIAAGLTPNRNAWNQLLTAIQTMLQGSTTNVGVDTGAANAYVVAFTPALPNPLPWVPFWFKVKTTNTGASTLNATGTVEPLVGAAHAALQGNELVANGNALVYWNPTLASGAGSYVLLFCSGAPEQVAPATEPLHAVQAAQVQASAFTTVVDTGAANAYVTTFAPALAAPVPGAPFWMKVKTTNTGASTLNATGSAFPILGAAHAALQGNELIANGWALFDWNATLNSYVLLECTGASVQVGTAVHSGQAPNFGQLTPMVAFNTVDGSNTTLTASVSFTAPSKGILMAWGGRNISGQDSVTHLCTLSINGATVDSDTTSSDMSFFGQTTIPSGQSVNAATQVACGVQFSARVMLMFIPTV